MKLRFFILSFFFFPFLLFAKDVTKNVTRVVSLAPSLTEMVYALGAEDKLVGVTRYCNYPAEVSNKIRVGGMLDPDTETLIRLKPDLILLSYSGNTHEQAEKFHKLGFRTASFKESSVSDIVSNFVRMATFLGVSSEHATNDFISRLRRVRPLSDTPSALVLLSWKPVYSVTSKTFIGDVLRISGLSNVVNSPVAYPVLSLEDLVRFKARFWIVPESMRTQRKEIERSLNKFNIRPIWIYINQDLLSRPGPRVPDAILDLTEKIRYFLK